VEVKVCGLINSENVQSFMHLPIHYVGHIYHPSSLRHYTDTCPLEIKNTIRRVGVFVDQPFELIQLKIRDWQLDVVQLHGDESIELAQEIKSLGVDVWKVVALKNESFNWNILQAYSKVVDRFLLDYKSDSKGGAGKKFNWNVLKSYPFQNPVMIAGGIGPNDASKVKSIFEQHPFLVGIDLNSCFETKPGVKDPALLASFLQELYDQ
jgi:phosphoribosylanthranilate isomerase